MTSRKKNKLSLFEAMHRAEPVPSAPPPRRPPPEPAGPGWWEWRARRREQRRAEKDARREAARAARDALIAQRAAEAAARAAESGPLDDRSVRFEGGRLSLSLGAISSMVVAACLCLVVLVAYSAGKRSASRGGPPVLAASKPSHPLGGVEPPAESPKTRVEQRVADVDLSALMQAPPSRPRKGEKIVAPVGPAPAANPLPPVAKPTEAAGVPEHKPLQYLQIETFRLGRGVRRADVLSEVEDVRKFLAARGIDTTAFETSTEILLVASRAFSSVKDSAAAEFKRLIEQHGREYRKSGGRYEFKGCFFRGETALPGTIAKKD